MPCLVLTPRLTSDSRHLEKAALELGWSVHRAIRYRLPPRIEDPIVHGEVVFCDVMASECKLGLLETSNDWLPDLPPEYLQRRVRLMQHEDLPTVTERSFIKPANDKVFEAGIFESGFHVPWRYIEPRTPVLVSDVVFFEFELRCYVLDRKVATAGVYALVDETLSSTKEQTFYDAGLEWISELLEDPLVSLPSAVVIDIGYISNVGWAVVEANQAYCSGIYVGGFQSEKASPGADPRAVLSVIQRAAGLRTQVRSEDERWLRP